jgi:hypothetical protein
MGVAHAFLLICAGANFNTSAPRDETFSMLRKMKKDYCEVRASFLHVQIKGGGLHSDALSRLPAEQNSLI